MLTNESLGRRIKELREKSGRTQDELASALRIKRELVSRIESGKRSVNYLEMKTIANFLGTTAEALVEEENRTPDLVALFKQSGSTDQHLLKNVQEIQELLDALLGQERLYNRMRERDAHGND